MDLIWSLEGQGCRLRQTAGEKENEEIEWDRNRNRTERDELSDTWASSEDSQAWASLKREGDRQARKRER